MSGPHSESPAFTPSPEGQTPAWARGLALPRAKSETWRAVGEVIEEEGAQPSLRLVLSGWAACCRSLADGRRQILQLVTVGDACGLPQPDAEPSRCTTVALTRVRIAEFGALSEIVRNPATQSLADLVRTAAARERREMLSHIVRLGRMSAYERTGHLLLELLDRQTRTGMAQGASMPLPLTQEVLADTLGLSVVHTNRILQQLRREGHISQRSGRIAFHDPERLASICDFTADPGAPARTEGVRLRPIG